MGVYIKGMNMPKSCDECLFSINGWCIAKFGIDTAIIYDDCRHHDCPLVEVKTQHGRLIDADIALKSEQPSDATDEQWAKTTLARCIINAPTVIESERKDDG